MSSHEKKWERSYNPLWFCFLFFCLWFFLFVLLSLANLCKALYNYGGADRSCGVKAIDLSNIALTLLVDSHFTFSIIAWQQDTISWEIYQIFLLFDCFWVPEGWTPSLILSRQAFHHQAMLPIPWFLIINCFWNFLFRGDSSDEIKLQKTHLTGSKLISIAERGT